PALCCHPAAGVPCTRPSCLPLRLPLRTPPCLLARLAVDGLAQEVGMSRVAAVLLDEVDEDPPQRDRVISGPRPVGGGECGLGAVGLDDPLQDVAGPGDAGLPHLP